MQYYFPADRGLLGSELILVMFDVNGNSGGVLFDTYTVAGDKTAANASCITTSTPTLTIKNNSTSKINTCDSVTFSISGGRKPYTVTVAETNSEITNNSTMGAKDNVYTWVNNLSPGNQVISEYLNSVCLGFVLTFSQSPFLTSEQLNVMFLSQCSSFHRFIGIRNMVYPLT